LKDEVEEAVRCLRHDIEIERETGRIFPYRYLAVIAGLASGAITLSGLLANFPQIVSMSISTTSMTLAAVLLTMAGGLILPLTRSMETEERFLQDLPDKMALDLRMLESRVDLAAQTKDQLRASIRQAYRNQHQRRQGVVMSRTFLGTSAKWLLSETLLALFLAFIQSSFTSVSVGVIFFLAAGYVTAGFVTLALVFPSLTKGLTG
jgi:hypothetical protein